MTHLCQSRSPDLNIEKKGGGGSASCSILGGGGISTGLGKSGVGLIVY